VNLVQLIPSILDGIAAAIPDVNLETTITIILLLTGNQKPHRSFRWNQGCPAMSEKAT
jgi:hypothetical protein